jgi:hypothetical protein
MWPETEEECFIGFHVDLGQGIWIVGCIVSLIKWREEKRAIKKRA